MLARSTTIATPMLKGRSVVFALVLLYVVIIALKLQRLEREVDALAAAGEAPQPDDEREPAQVG